MADEIEAAPCRLCGGKGTHSHNINFGSGPKCYVDDECDVCRGTGKMPTYQRKAEHE